MSSDGGVDPKKGYTTQAHPSDIDRAVFLGDQHADNMYSAFMVMATELWSLRRRQKVLEALLSSRRPVTLEAIETFIPSPEQAAAWQRDRDQFVKAIYDPFLRRDGVIYHESLRFDPS